MSKNQLLWAKEIQTNQMLYPNERVVGFLAKNYKKNINNNVNMKALDIGFGSGRHLKLLKDYNFDIHGLEYNQICIDTCKKLFDINDDNKLKLEELSKCSFEKESFDVIIAWGVIFLKNVSEISKDLNVISNLMKSKGKMILNFRTKDDFLYQNGRSLDDNTKVLNYGPYNGMTYTFFTKSEVEKVLINAGFKIIGFERDDYWKNNLSEHNSWWIVSVEKE